MTRGGCDPRRLLYVSAVPCCPALSGGGIRISRNHDPAPVFPSRIDSFDKGAWVMIDEHFAQIRESLEGGEKLSAAEKLRLLELLGELRTEVEALARSRDRDAMGVSLQAVASAREAVRNPRRPEVLGETLRGFVASVEGLENTHPRLVATVNRIAFTLSGMGI